MESGDTLPPVEIYVDDDTLPRENVPIDNPIPEVHDPLAQENMPDDIPVPHGEVDLDNPFEPILDVEPEASLIWILTSIYTSKSHFSFIENPMQGLSVWVYEPTKLSTTRHEKAQKESRCRTDRGTENFKRSTREM